jgi:hypothetical protein
MQPGGVNTTCEEVSASGRRSLLSGPACGEAVSVTATIEVVSPSATHIAALRAALHALLAGPGSDRPSLLGACSADTVSVCA